MILPSWNFPSIFEYLIVCFPSVFWNHLWFLSSRWKKASKDKTRKEAERIGRYERDTRLSKGSDGLHLAGNLRSAPSLTQEFLSNVLGVPRATVNVATAMLKKAGFIHLGSVNHRDLSPDVVLGQSCDCYQSHTPPGQCPPAFRCSERRRTYNLLFYGLKY